MKKVFALFGSISLDGVNTIHKQLTDLDKGFKEFSKGMAKAGRDLDKLGVALTKTFTAPIVAAGAAITMLAKQTGEYAARILDLQHVTGMSTDTLQKWKYAIEQSGGNFDSFIGIIARFTNKVPEIAEGGNAASDAFNRLGVSLKDSSGNIRSMDELFPEMIYALQGVENVTDRNALAQDMFGSSLDDLGPVLGMTREQLEQYFAAAQESGAVMSGDALQGANDLRETIAQLQSTFASIGREVAVAFVPILRDTVAPMIKGVVVPAVRDLVGKIKEVVDWFSRLSPGMQESIIKFAAVLAILGPLAVGLGSVMKAVAGLRGTVLLLNAALLSNPFALAATAAAALSVGLWATKDAFKDLNKEIDKKNVEKMKGNLEELVYELTRMQENADPWESVEAFNAANERISALRQNLSALGVYIEGDYTQMFIKAYDKLNELNGRAAPAKPAESGSGGSNYSNIRKLSEKELYEQFGAIRKEAQERDISETKAIYDRKLDLNNDFLKADQAQADAMLKARDQGRQDELAADQAQADAMLNAQNSYLEQKAEREQVFTEGALQMQNSIFDAFRARNDNKMFAIDEAYAKERAAIEGSTKSREEQQRLLEALDEKTAKKKRELLRKQAILEKVAGLFSVGVSTAMAIMKAFATLAYPLNIVAAVFAGVTGAIQTAIIASKPIPAAEKGAFLPGSPEGTLIRAGEKSKPEIILPLDDGVDAFMVRLFDRARGFTSQIAQQVAPSIPGAPAVAMAGAGGSGGGAGSEIHWHIHAQNIIADNHGLKELERTLHGIRMSEATRKGSQ